MVIAQCPYCELDTPGNHYPECPYQLLAVNAEYKRQAIEYSNRIDELEREATNWKKLDAAHRKRIYELETQYKALKEKG